MASILSAGTTSATALNMSADTSGVLQLASNNGTVAVTIDTSQNIYIGSGTSYNLKDFRTNSISSTGYQKLPGGLIIQWQSYNGGATSGTITFPIAFPNKVVAIQASYDNTGTAVNGFAFDSVGGSTSSINFWNGVLIGFNWMAIGY